MYKIKPVKVAVWSEHLPVKAQVFNTIFMTLLRTARWYRDRKRINPRSWKRKGLKLHCSVAFPKTGHRAALPICAVQEEGCALCGTTCLKAKQQSTSLGHHCTWEKLDFQKKDELFFCNTELCSLKDWVNHFVALVQPFISITDTFCDQKPAKQHTDLFSFTTAALEHALHQNNSPRNSLKSAVCSSEQFCNKLM